MTDKEKAKRIESKLIKDGFKINHDEIAGNEIIEISCGDFEAVFVPCLNRLNAPHLSEHSDHSWSNHGYKKYSYPSYYMALCAVVTLQFEFEQCQEYCLKG